MNNDITTLRSHLFETLAALRDKENPMDVERAKAICTVGDVIIDSAKAEIDFARVNGSVDSQFFSKPNYAPRLENKTEGETETPDHIRDVRKMVTPDADKPADKWQTKNGSVTVKNGVTRHKLR